MRKIGYASFLIYLLYIAYGIFWIGLGIYYNFFAPPEENPVMHLELFFGVGLLLLGLIFVGLKSLHLKTGFGLLSFLCALADAFGVFVIWTLFILPSGDIYREVPIMILSLFPAFACITNLVSMKR